jgi:hypothetical protein
VTTAFCPSWTIKIPLTSQTKTKTKAIAPIPNRVVDESGLNPPPSPPPFFALRNGINADSNLSRPDRGQEGFR